jgi:hypothetical protein
MFALCRANKDGFQGWCRACINEARRKPAKSPEELAAEKQKRREAHLQKKREYHAANRAAHAIRMAEHYAKNSEMYKARSARWKAENRDRWNAKCMERHTQKLRACPNWLSDDDHWMIQEAYDLAQLREKLCGGKWHVDHIVPLRGKTVSGLHTPWNLQVIPASINCAKRNTWQ